MKKSLVGVILAIVLLLFSPSFVSAASSCSYSEQAELNNIVANVKINYEIEEVKTEQFMDPDDPEEMIDITVKKIKINILNITDDVYVVLKNDLDNQSKTFYKKNTTDGIVSFYQDDKDTIVNYTLEVYSNKYSCAGELYKKLTLTTPIYNSYSELEACSENPEFYYCQEFITTKQITYDKFIENLKEYVTEEEISEEKEKSMWDKIKEFYSNNKITINVLGTIIVVGGITATVILVKRRRSRIL